MPCGSSSHAIKVIRMPQNTHLCIAEIKDNNQRQQWCNSMDERLGRSRVIRGTLIMLRWAWSANRVPNPMISLMGEAQRRDYRLQGEIGYAGNGA